MTAESPSKTAESKVDPHKAESRFRGGVGWGFGAGKVILLGEHSVVYGRPALAAGLLDGVEATVRRARGTPGRVRCEAWKLDVPLEPRDKLGLALCAVLPAAGAPDLDLDIELRTHLPHSSGLGSSAAVCVSVARAVSEFVGRPLSDEQAAEVALAGERSFHGNPSGIDNTIAALGGLLWFKKPAEHKRIPLPKPLPLVIANSGSAGETSTQVELVRKRHEKDPGRCEKLFDEMGSLVDAAVRAIGASKLDELGRHMDRGHECLRELGVSTSTLDEMVAAARKAGAIGAKLTGAGGGGCVVALCPDRPQRVVEALEARGWHSFFREVRSRE